MNNKMDLITFEENIENYILLHFNDNVSIMLTSSSFIYINSKYLQSYLPLYCINCPSTYVMDKNNTCYFTYQHNLSFMFMLDKETFNNLCIFLDLINYVDNNDNITKYIKIIQFDHIRKSVMMNDKENIKYISNLLIDKCKDKLDLNLIKCFIDNGADITYQDNDGNTILHYVVLLDDNDIVIKYLIEQYKLTKNTHDASKYINIQNNDGLSTMHNAASNLNVIKYLHEQGGDINLKTKNGSTIMHNITYTDGEMNDELIKYFIDNGIDINLKNNDGDTALHNICELIYGLEIITLFVKYGADINIQNNYGDTALHVACQFKEENVREITDGDEEVRYLCCNFECVKYLIDNGANIHIQNSLGETALHYAVMQRNNIEVIEYFINHGADVNLKTNSGDSILFYALDTTNNIKNVKYLIEHGAKVFESGISIAAGGIVIVKNNNKETVLHIASLQKNNLEVIKYLIEYIKKIKNNNIASVIRYIKLKDEYGDSALDNANKDYSTNDVVHYLTNV